MVVFVSTEKNDENLFVCYSKSISAPYGFMPYLGSTPAEPCSSTFFDGIFYTLRMQPLSWEHSSLVKTLYRIIIFVIVEEHKIIQYVYSFSENTKVQHKLRRAIDNIHMHVVIKTRYICPWNHLKLSLILNSEMQFAIIQFVFFSVGSIKNKHLSMSKLSKWLLIQFFYEFCKKKCRTPTL